MFATCVTDCAREMLQCIIVILLCFCPVVTIFPAEQRVQVDDACCEVSDEGHRCVIGTAAVRLTFASNERGFHLVSYQNLLVEPAREYIDPSTAMAPFALKTPLSGEGRFLVETVWEKFLPNSARIDPADDGLAMEVHQGDLIGFSVGPHGDFGGDETDWVTTVDYGDGECYTSTQDRRLEQGPIWYYYVHRPHTGQLELIDSLEMLAYSEEQVRIPAESSPWRSPGSTPHVGSTKLHPSAFVDAVRVWRAPRDGKISIRGEAKHFKGYGDTDVKVLRIREKPPGYVAPPIADMSWTHESSEAIQVATGGRPAVQLDIRLRHQQLRAHLHVLAYPHTPVLRQWVELENTSSEPVSLPSPTPLRLMLRGDEASQLRQFWMIGGNSGPTQGLLESHELTASYHHTLEGQMTDAFIPWTALQRKDPSGDGAFVALEYLGGWRLRVDLSDGGSLVVGAEFPELVGRLLAAGEQLALPLVTLGVFSRDLDDMGVRLYDWQYEYLWDYTHHDWHSLMAHPVPWWPDSQNLQENFAGRLGGLDMAGVDIMRDIGFELLWDDAGWSESPNIWTPTREGPDYAQTLRYLPKYGMKWALWFCGRPSAGLMDTKVGSWGNFQWRTDGIGTFDLSTDSAYRNQIADFLRRHPRSSFHTCNGGGRYAHTFEIQRFTDVNYFSDAGRGEQTNCYLSYLDTPDKWLDIITAFQTAGEYPPDRGRTILTMAPVWYLKMAPEDNDQVRRIGAIYHFLLREGVAGRWSYVFHPMVQGDEEHAYFQRTSRDRTQACIIIKHQAPDGVTVFPRGLLPDHEYVVGFDSHNGTVIRRGHDLMAQGIQLSSPVAGELIYLGLPFRPGSGADTVAPTAPGRVLSRRETNLGHTGIGLYWSPGTDDHATSYYEVRRDGQVVGKAATGTYYFDHSENWNAAANYAVRTVDCDGNTSDWTAAQPLFNGPLEFSALGGHFAQSKRDGWLAESSADGHEFVPMTWVPPARYSAGDTGGTANQIGGAEGYWESAGGARVGRGWQQGASDEACVRAWLAPQTGTVRVVGRAMKEYYHRHEGEPLRICILHGETQVWPLTDMAVVPVGDTTGLTHDLRVDVTQGDTIRFVLDKVAQPETALLTWMPRIVYDDVEAGEDLPDGVVRILCGVEHAYTDQCGNVWSADKYFSGGRPVVTTETINNTLPTSADQTLYRAGRAGSEFVYSIPVPVGIYSLRLKLAEPQFDWFFERPLHLDINGRRVLSNFDICHAARGPRRAYECVFRYLVPDEESRLVLRFTTGRDPQQSSHDAIVQAIEVLPEQKSVVRIDVGSNSPYVDWNGFTWAADTDFRDGQRIANASAVAQASPTLHDQSIYQTACAGKHLRYRVPVRPGLYSVHLQFAELWLPEVGKRAMDIQINGRLVRTAWDPASAAGQLSMAADFRVEDMTPDSTGHIVIDISACGDEEAILQGIEIE